MTQSKKKQKKVLKFLQRDMIKESNDKKLLFGHENC